MEDTLDLDLLKEDIFGLDLLKLKEDLLGLDWLEWDKLDLGK